MVTYRASLPLPRGSAIVARLVRSRSPIMPAVIREAHSPADLEQAFAIRRRVFVEEQNVGEDQEFDGRDEEARHLLASIDGEPAGTLRIRVLDGGWTAKIERVAVLAAERRHRVGRGLMLAALDLALAQGACEARVHAQTAVQAFYAGLGFVPFGAEFEEDGIRHIAMRLMLA
jgi:predicted GNAT family N-acyltransferase